MASKDSSTRQGQQHQQSAGDDAGAAQAGRQSPASQTGGVTQASVPLIDGEEVLIDARPAWSAFSLQIIAAVLIFVGGLAAGDAAVIGGFVFAAFILGYVVTDRRMMQVMGISSSATSEAWMVDVRGLQTGASFIERFLGHGHITISTDIQGGGLSRFRSGMTFGGVSNYEEIAHIIRQRQNAAKMD